MKRFGLYLVALTLLFGCRTGSHSHVALNKIKAQRVTLLTARKPKKLDFHRMINQTVALTFIATKIYTDGTPTDVVPAVATGVIIDIDSILTVAHFIKGAQDYVAAGYTVSGYLVEFAGGYAEQLAELELMRADLDLALVKIYGVLPIAGPTLAKEMASLGDFVYTVGSNMTLDGFDLKMGIVAREIIVDDNAYDGIDLNGQFALNIAAMPGNSGSPVFNTRGELVGLLQSSVANYRDGDGFVWPMHIAGAAPIESIRELLSQKPPKEVETPCKSKMDPSLGGLKSPRCSKTN